MTDKVYPSSKPNPPPPSMNTTAGPPAAKPQLYNPTRPRRRRCSGRRFCCLCFIYTLILILVLLLAAAIAGSIFYVLYHPKHPTFSITAVKISAFNLSDSPSGGFSHLTSKLDFVLSAKNPNSKLSFLYSPFSVALASSASTLIGAASLPAFAHSPGNTTILRATVASDPNHDIDPDSAGKLKTDLAKKSGFPISVRVDTKVEVKMGKLKTNRVGIRVLCDGIRGFLPKRNATSKKTTPATASTADAKCKVDLRIKIWKFTF